MTQKYGKINEEDLDIDDISFFDLDNNDVEDNDGQYPEVGESLISQGSKSKYKLKEVKSLSPNVLLKLISRAKNFLKKDKVWKKICKEYDQDPDIIDYIPTSFANLDVSAKTYHGIVLLNYKLLVDGDFFKDYSYLIHEYTHWFQQCYGDKPTQGSSQGSYLDNKFEQEGFQNQIKYIDEHQGEEEAKTYVKKLLDHHDVKKKTKKDELESILMKKVDQ